MEDEKSSALCGFEASPLLLITDTRRVDVERGTVTHVPTMSLCVRHVQTNVRKEK